MAADQLNVPENPSKNFNEYFRLKLGRDPPSDDRNTPLVVTTLIVAVTFQAGMNPPGGVWHEDKHSPENCPAVTAANNCTIIRQAGKAILASNKASYALFIFANTLAFSASCTILSLLLTCLIFNERHIWCFNCCCASYRSIQMGVYVYCFYATIFLKGVFYFIKRYK